MQKYYLVFNDDLSRNLYSSKYYKINDGWLYKKENGLWKIVKNVGSNWIELILERRKNVALYNY
jgi:hypothetical protein